MERYDGKFVFSTMEGNQPGYEGEPMKAGALYTTDICDTDKYQHSNDTFLSVNDSTAKEWEKGTIYRSHIIHA